MKKVLTLSAWVWLLIVQAIPAQVPSTLGYQSVLFDGSGVVVADGTYSITFKLYDAATGGTALWTETQSVATSSGVFNAILGSATSLNLPFDTQYWLGISVEGGAELSPRVQLTASPYSFTAQSVADGVVTSAQIADGAVAAGDLADNAVTTTKVQDGAVTAAKIASDAVTSAKIADGTVALADLAHAAAVKSINGLTDTVTLVAGSNVTLAASGNTLTIAASGAGGGNTLDQAYDQGGAGAGRTITADNGAVSIVGTDGLVVSGTLSSGSIPTTGAGVRMMFYPNKAAFRAGYVDGTQWDDGNIGDRSTVSGGYNNIANYPFATVSGGSSNTASHSYSVVGGGHSNTASGNKSTVGGGNSNTAGTSDYATVGGGDTNVASGLRSTVPGGYLNTAAGDYSFAAGRQAKTNHTGAFVWADQTAADFASTGDNQFLIRASGGVGIGTTSPGGQLHVQDGSVLFAGTTGTTPASGAGTRLMWIPAKGAFRAGVVASTQWDDASIGTHSTVGGGYNNTASGSRSTISGGSGNTAGNYAAVGGGNSNNASGGYAAIGGGDDNTASGGAATIGGGYQNAAGGFATVAGGANNNASGAYAAVGGGSNNQASGIRAMVPGGVSNLAAGNYSFAGGRRAKANHTGTFVWTDSTDADFASTDANQFLIRAGGGLVAVGTFGSGTIPATGAGTRLMWYPKKAAFRAGYVDGTQWDDGSIGDYSTVGGGRNNTASSYGTVSGGDGNRAGSSYATVGGGQNNTAATQNSTVSGGQSNTTNGSYATIGGGTGNDGAMVATVGGGQDNNASGVGATVAGGKLNIASGEYSTIAGGYGNAASGIRAMVPGGLSNTAAGDYSFAAGRQAKANHGGAFVWADQTAADFASTAANQFLIRAAGGVGIGTGAPGSQLTVKGAGTTSATSSLNVTDSGGSSLLFVRDDGNVGIGTTSPSEKLHVAGSLQFGATPGLKSVDGGFSFTSSGTNVGPTVFLVPTGSGSKSQIQLYGQSSTSEGTRLELFQEGAHSTLRNQVLGGGANGSIRFDHNGTTNLIIGSDGKVGIGATSPGSRVEIKGEGNTSGTSSLAVFSSGSSPLLFVQDDGKVGIGRTDPAWTKLDILGGGWRTEKTSGNLSNEMRTNETAPHFSYISFKTGVYSAISGYTRFNAPWEFGICQEGNGSSVPADRFYFGRSGLSSTDLVINSAGNVGIGISSPTNLLTVKQTSATDPIADAWTTYSSRRWKTNAQPIPEALEKVQRLRGVSFDWKANGQHDIGLIAEEVGEVIPEVVAYEENGTDAKSVDYARLVAVLIEAIKEQQQEIEQQQEAMATLAARLTLLEQAVQRASAAIPAQRKASWSD